MIRTVFMPAIAVALCATNVHAQSSSAEAESLFKQARELMGQKKYAEACAAFESSQKLDPTATTMYSLAVCRQLEGKLATAWGVLIDFERAHRNSTDPSVVELRKKASERAQSLEPRLSKLTIVVSPEASAPDLVVLRGGTETNRGTWGRSLPVDGGSHAITAKRPGHKDWTTTVTTKTEGDSQTVTIPVLEAALVEPVPVEPQPTPEPVDPRPTAESRSKVVPIVFAGGALALGGAALGFEFWGRGMHDDAQAALDGGDEARANDLQDGANLRRYLAQGFAVAAVGCAVVSVVMFVRGGSEPTDRTAVRLVPSMSPDQAGLSLVGGW
jgi:hypothetical protein